MNSRPLPYYFEDRTGDYAGSDFDEAYDRLFLHVARPSPTHPALDAETTLLIYDTGRRSSSRRPQHTRAEPAAVLEFGAAGALGAISFVREGVSMPMGQYLRRTSMFAG